MDESLKEFLRALGETEVESEASQLSFDFGSRPAPTTNS
jgi:hypothetical protein